MRINSKNMFKSIETTEKRLNAIEKRISLKERRLLQANQNSINFMKFFDAGYQKGIDEGEKTGFKDGQTKGFQTGYETGYEEAEKENENIEERQYGGPVTKGKPYLVGESGVEQFMPNLPGLGGGGGGTNSITDKAKTKTMGNYMKDALKMSTIPARFLLGIESPVDETEKFASPSTPEDKVSSAISNYVQAESNNNEFGNITSSVVNKPRVQTVVQPVIQTKTQRVPTPVPMSSKTQVIKTTKSKLPPSIAKMIN
tara:strand:+ start:1930 stop:2697 length:768 start_codon:yes stop_codon:yes gene_type:complete